MKGPSEAKVGDALRRLGWDAYKPPDDARNQKPCDFFAWSNVGNGWVMGLSAAPDDLVRCVWIEVKMERGPTFAGRDLRPGQRLGIARAQRLGIPYWLVIQWPARWHVPGSPWTALELTNIDRAQVWATGLPLLGTQWDSIQPSAIAVLEEVIGAGSAEPHGQSGQAVRERQGSHDLSPDGGGGVGSVPSRSGVPR